MKKILTSIILTFVLITGLTISPYALETSDFHEDVTVNFKEDSIFTDAEKEIITNYFKSGNDGQAETHGLTCTLFGHDYKEEYITAITHKVYDNIPRCVEEVYEVNICTRCSHTESRRIGLSRINCCP